MKSILLILGALATSGCRTARLLKHFFVILVLSLSVIACSKKVELQYSWKDKVDWQFDGVIFSTNEYKSSLEKCERVKTYYEQSCECDSDLQINAPQSAPNIYTCSVKRNCGLLWKCVEK